MELVLEKADSFKKCIDAIAVLIDEAEFILSEKGLELKATDPSQISMVDFKLDKKAFKKFDAKENTRLGLDLDYLSQVLSRAKPTEDIEIVLDEKGTSLLITFRGDSTRSFKVPLIDISASDIPNPKVDFDAEMVLKADFLQDALKDAALISNHISLSVDASKFFVKALYVNPTGK